MDPVTRSWKAILDLRRGREPTLRVSGLVHHPIEGYIPTLEIASAQGILAQKLFLTLDFIQQIPKDSDNSSETEVRFETPANQGQYTHVAVFHNNAEILEMAVEELT